MVVKQSPSSKSSLLKKRKANKTGIGPQNATTKKINDKVLNAAEDSIETNANHAASGSDGVSTFKRLKLGHKFVSECELSKAQAIVAVSTTYKAHSVWKSTNKADLLFSDESEIINLQVSMIKLPNGAGHPISSSLPHPILKQDSDIMLVVKDLEKGWEKSHEPTVDFYTELLAKKGVTGSYEVIPLRQLRVENKPYEARNKLSKRFNAVLVDKRVAKFVPRYLGKAFYSSGKLPVSIDLEKEDLNKEFSKALATSVMSMTNDGVSSRIAVGRTDQLETEVVDNILAVCENLKKKLPGGFANVRTLSIQIGNHSWSVPVYVSFATRDMVNLPNADKDVEPIIDELTTLDEGWKVAVYPGGNVKKIKDKSVGKPSKNASNASENVDEDQINVVEKPRFKRAPIDADVESSDDDGDMLEEQYLEEIEKTEEDSSVANPEVPSKRKK